MSLSRTTFIVKEDGTLWTCGNNQYGQLGIGDTVSKNALVQVVGVNDVKQVACGLNFTFIQKNDNSLWSCGNNQYGQLGLGNTSAVSTFTQVDIDNVKSISCGNNHVFVLKNDGTLYGCGRNYNGQLGIGIITNQYSFVKVEDENIVNVKQVACGDGYTFIVKDDGTLWSCGYNNYGQLGLGDTTNRNVFTQVDIDNVKQVACGYYHVIAVKNDGTVWTCGYNGKGQLGLGNTSNKKEFIQSNIDNVAYVSCGYAYTYALKNDDTLWACGDNSSGQLGLVDTTNRNSFTQIEIDNVKQITPEYAHTIILKDDGTLWTCGNNQYGQLGFGNTIGVSIFTQVEVDSVKIVQNFSFKNIILFIILANGTNYTIENNELVQIENEITTETIKNNGVKIEVINDNMNIMPDEFKLLSNKQYKLNSLHINNNKELVVNANYFVTTVQDNIYYFKAISDSDNDSLIKVVFSIDEGITWKTYSEDNGFLDLSITIPLKDYNNLTANEMVQWNNARDNIYENGILVSDLENIDFNTLEFNNIKFAYVISTKNIDSVCNISKLQWKYDKKPTMQLMDNTEYTIGIGNDSIEFKSNIDNEKVKLNITTGNSIGSSGGSDIEFATQEEIDDAMTYILREV